MSKQSLRRGIPRLLHNSVLGFYTSSFFRIGIETNVTFRHMSSEDYSVLAHEYTHFLQDITTLYGAYNAYAVSEYIKTVAEAIRNAPHGVLDVPYTPENNSNNVFANYFVRECTYGDTKVINCIKEIIEIHNLKELLESAQLNAIPYIEIELVDGEGKTHRINFGACAVMESMAYLMESYIAPKKFPAPDYPYSIAEILVKEFYPEFAQDPLNILALCDAALLTSAPGHTFVCYLVQFKEDAWLPEKAEDIYDRTLDGGYINQGSNPGLRSFEEEMEEMRQLAIDSLFSYFNPSMVKYRKWIEKTISLGFALRVEKRDFILDIARAGDITHNAYMKALFESILGTPVMTNPTGEGTIKSPNVHFDSDFFLFPAVGEIIKLFDQGITTCDLKPVCSKLGGCVDAKCDTEPWEHEVRMDKLCPYSLMWHNWNFGLCKPHVKLLSLSSIKN